MIRTLFALLGALSDPAPRTGRPDPPPPRPEVTPGQKAFALRNRHTGRYVYAIDDRPAPGWRTGAWSPVTGSDLKLAQLKPTAVRAGAYRDALRLVYGPRYDVVEVTVPEGHAPGRPYLAGRRKFGRGR